MYILMKKVERIQVLSRKKRVRERRKLSQVGKIVLLSRLLLIGEIRSHIILKRLSVERC